MDREDPLRVLLEGRPGIGKTSRAASSPCSATSDLLGRDVAVVATVQRHHHPFTDALKRRPDVGVLPVAEQTRNALPDQLALQLRRVGVRGRPR